NTFTLPLLGRAEATGANPRRTFWLLYSLTAGLAATGFLALGPFGHYIVPLLFGPSTIAILPELTRYGAGIALFTLANLTVTYHISKKNYAFPLLSLAAAVLMAVAIIFNHGSISAIASSIWLAGLLSFLVITAADLGMVWFVSFSSWRKLSKIPPRQRDKLEIPGAGAKRILILNWRDVRHAQAGGAEVYIHELAKCWQQLGHETTLFCGNDGNSPRHEVVDTIKTVRRGGFATVYIWAFVYYFTRFRKRFDIIVDCHNGIPFFTPLYAREPVYCVVHHVHQEVFTQYLTAPKAFIARFLEKTAMPLVYRRRQFLTVSDSSKAAMIDELGIPAGKIEIVHNGVDLEQLVPGSKAEQPTVLYVGRLKRYKSVDTLIKAFSQIKTRVPTARLIIAGTGDDAARLNKLVAKLDLASSVSFRGRVTEQEKIRLLQSAWVFVNPSYREGWGITTIEANACGTPVIASDVPGLRDSVNAPSAGYLVEYGNHEAFAQKIHFVLSDEAQRSKMSISANTWARNFDWQVSATAFMKVMS
ncbi:MAG TPA: glycosyltransferase family 4 protein, partial [Candidatus Polarisedimenticolaceae bacterium]|nr:glycosyltransferase family 4 protein [Candidatus Polarisedimenticolaceae bacterium]